ncbi:MAG: hypothetical protein ACKOCN_09600 [Planctomycetaceae bacterium]
MSIKPCLPYGFTAGMLASALLIAGCGSGKEPGEKISGRVQLGKKAVPSGTVSFIADGKGGSVAATQITNGRYSLEVPKGSYRITVTTPAKAGSPPEGTPDSQNLKKTKTIEIPARYGDFGNSGLSLVVKKGPQSHDIALKPDPPPPPPPAPAEAKPAVDGQPPSEGKPADAATPNPAKPATDESRPNTGLEEKPKSPSSESGN